MKLARIANVSLSTALTEPISWKNSPIPASLSMQCIIWKKQKQNICRAPILPVTMATIVYDQFLFSLAKCLGCIGCETF